MIPQGVGWRKQEAGEEKLNHQSEEPHKFITHRYSADVLFSIVLFFY